MRQCETRQPLISFLLVVRNEADYVDECLGSMLRQTLDADQYEIVVVDGESSDDTRERVRRIMRDHPERAIRLLGNPGRVLSTGWNIGIREARGTYIVRPDGHARVPEDFLAKSLAVAEEQPDASAVGGRIHTAGRGFWGAIIAAVLSSRFGVGNSDFRVGAPAGPGNPVFALYKRAALIEIGGLDESLPLNQDNVCHAELRANGHILYMDPRIITTYYCRSSLAALSKAMGRRAMWVVLMTRHTDHLVLEPRYLVPLAFVTVLASGAAGGLLWPPLWWCLALLLGVYITSAYAMIRAEGLSLIQRILLPVASLVTHVSYGVGAAVGLLRLPFYRPSRDGMLRERVSRVAQEQPSDL